MNFRQFEYMERRNKDKVDIVTQHTFANYPSNLKKKVILLEHFNSYLDGGKINKEIVKNVPNPLGLGEIFQ